MDFQIKIDRLRVLQTNDGRNPNEADEIYFLVDEERINPQNMRRAFYDPARLNSDREYTENYIAENTALYEADMDRDLWEMKAGISNLTGVILKNFNLKLGDSDTTEVYFMEQDGILSSDDLLAGFDLNITYEAGNFNLALSNSASIIQLDGDLNNIWFDNELRAFGKGSRYNLNLGLNLSHRDNFILGSSQDDILDDSKAAFPNQIPKYIFGGPGIDTYESILPDGVNALLSNDVLRSGFLLGLASTDVELFNVERARLVGGNMNEYLSASEFSFGGSPSNEFGSVEILSSGVTLEGGNGDDTLIGSRGNTTLLGGNGNDSLDGSFSVGLTLLQGGNGDDTLVSSKMNFNGLVVEHGDTLSGGSGQDKLDGYESKGRLLLEGGSGNDTLIGALGKDRISNIDTLRGGEGHDIFYLGDGTKVFYVDERERLGEFLDVRDYYATLDDFNIIEDRLRLTNLDNSVYVFAPAFSEGVEGKGIFLDREVITNRDAETSVGDNQIGYIPDTQAGPDSDYVDYIEGSFDTSVHLISNSQQRSVSVQNIIYALELDDSAQNTSGTSLADWFVGNDSHNLVHALEGNDYISGKDGDDELYGNEGNDLIYAGLGNDRLFGGYGLDTLKAGSGHDYLFGHAGDDELIGNEGNDYLHGATGNDRVDGSEGNDSLIGMEGDDTIIGGQGSDRFIFSIGHGTDFITDFNPAEDVIAFTTDFADDPFGFHHLSNTQSGVGVYWDNNDGDNNPGQLIIELSELDASQLSLRDRYFHQAIVREQDSNIDAPILHSTISGTEENDTLRGESGNEELNGLAGDDRLFGGYGRDSLNGGTGNDDLFGNYDDDTIVGGEGNDYLHADTGADVLLGDTGHDTLIGGAGDDILTGGTGRDRFVIGTSDGLDVIKDFNPAEDIIAFDRKFVEELTGVHYLRDTSLGVGVYWDANPSDGDPGRLLVELEGWSTNQLNLSSSAFSNVSLSI